MAWPGMVVWVNSILILPPGVAIYQLPRPLSLPLPLAAQGPFVFSIKIPFADA